MAKVVVLSGAGISAESGFSTFRDSDGLWNKFKVEDVATPEGYAKNPQLVLDFYNGLRRDLYKAEPNKGHLELAELERESILERQREGIEIAKEEGKYKGRKPVSVDEDKFKAVCKRWKDGEITATTAMKELGLKPNTFYRRVKEMNI